MAVTLNSARISTRSRWLARSLPRLLPLTLALSLSAGAVSANALNENFDGGVPADWTVINRSEPLGASSWFQGNPAVFGAQQGAANSYVGVNFNSGADVATLSNWLILPTSTYHNGDTLSFYTRTAASSTWADRLEVRYSALGGTDVGHTANSVGSFSNLLLSINPDLNVGGYPDAWTRYSVTLNGLAGASEGAFAFHYAVDNGGPNGDNSNFIGIDTLSVTAAVPEPSTYLMLGTGLALLGWARRRHTV